MAKWSSGSKKRVRRGLWSPEEDEKLLKHIAKCGHGNWSSVPKKTGLDRCGKSCRLRWTNYLRADIKRGAFSKGEEDLIIHLHSILGNKWSCIAGQLPGRTDNDVKNLWNAVLKKKLRQRRIDPATHKPIAEGSRTAPVFSDSEGILSSLGPAVMNGAGYLDNAPAVPLWPSASMTSGNFSPTAATTFANDNYGAALDELLWSDNDGGYQLQYYGGGDPHDNEGAMHFDEHVLCSLFHDAGAPPHQTTNSVNAYNHLQEIEWGQGRGNAYHA